MDTPPVTTPLSNAPPVDPYLMARRRHRRRWAARVALHGILLVATFFTLSVAGTWWEGQDFDSPGFVQSLAHGTTYAFWVVAILGAHEMGHYLACVYYRIPATLPFFLPGPPFIGSLGAVIRIRGPIPHRRALFDVAAAGPIAGFVVAVPALLLGILNAEPYALPVEGQDSDLALGESAGVLLIRWLLLGGGEPLRVNSLFVAGWVGLLVTSLNLFPVGQLDGGHAAYALSRRLHRVLAWGSLFGLAFIIVLQAWMHSEIPPYLLWFAILLWMRDRHPTLLDESQSLGAGRRCVALLLVLIFVLSFTFVPFRIV